VIVERTANVPGDKGAMQTPFDPDEASSERVSRLIAAGESFGWSSRAKGMVIQYVQVHD
jgi:hypothetical protein